MASASCAFVKSDCASANAAFLSASSTFAASASSKIACWPVPSKIACLSLTSFCAASTADWAASSVACVWVAVAVLASKSDFVEVTFWFAVSTAALALSIASWRLASASCAFVKSASFWETWVCAELTSACALSRFAIISAWPVPSKIACLSLTSFWAASTADWASLTDCCAWLTTEDWLLTASCALLTTSSATFSASWACDTSFSASVTSFWAVTTFSGVAWSTRFWASLVSCWALSYAVCALDADCVASFTTCSWLLTAWLAVSRLAFAASTSDFVTFSVAWFCATSVLFDAVAKTVSSACTWVTTPKLAATVAAAVTTFALFITSFTPLIAYSFLHYFRFLN